MYRALGSSRVASDESPAGCRRGNHSFAGDKIDGRNVAATAANGEAKPPPGNGHVYFRATRRARGFAERGRCENRAFPLAGLLVRHKDRAPQVSASVCRAGNYAAAELSAAANYAGTSARIT